VNENNNTKEQESLMDTDDTKQGGNEDYKSTGRQILFAVFDGHGGQLASTFVSGCLHKNLVKSSHYPRYPKRALRESFLITDSAYAKKYPVNGLQDGSTGCVVLIIGHRLYVANVGDSRAVLCRSGKAIELSFDHKPDRDIEKKRIEAIGGIVKKGSFFNIPMGPFRIYTADGVRGGLAVARAFGDTFYKEATHPVDKQLVIAVPEITERTIDNEDEFIIVASDGFWDVFSNEEAVKLVRDLKNTKKQNPTEVSTALTTEAFTRDSLDNITVIVAFLGDWDIEGGSSEKETEDESTEEASDVIIHTDINNGSQTLPSSSDLTYPDTSSTNNNTTNNEDSLNYSVIGESTDENQEEGNKG